MKYTIECSLSLSNADINFLSQQINQETPEFGSAYPFGFFIRDNHDAIIAGCNGSVIFGVIYSDQLWVHPDYRKQGYARKLMESVHDYAREVGCTMATVQTMDFQNARPFYENLGYVCDFERPGYAKGSSCFFLRKTL